MADTTISVFKRTLDSYNGFLHHLLAFCIPCNWISGSKVIIPVILSHNNKFININCRIEMKPSAERNHTTNFGNSVWSVYSIFVLQGVEFSTKGFGRALEYAGFAFILSLMITSAYSGGLASVMTVPRYLLKNFIKHTRFTRVTFYIHYRKC